MNTQIELKQIKLGIHSEETLDYKAVLYVNGTAAAYVSNTGQGGETRIDHMHGIGRDLIKQAEQYVTTLPPEPSPYGDINMTLDFWCDIEARKEEIARQVRRLQKRNL